MTFDAFCLDHPFFMIERPGIIGFSEGVVVGKGMDGSSVQLADLAVTCNSRFICKKWWLLLESIDLVRSVFF